MNTTTNTNQHKFQQQTHVQVPLKRYEHNHVLYWGEEGKNAHEFNKSHWCSVHPLNHNVYTTDRDNHQMSVYHHIWLARDQTTESSSTLVVLHLIMLVTVTWPSVAMAECRCSQHADGQYLQHVWQEGKVRPVWCCYHQLWYCVAVFGGYWHILLFTTDGWLFCQNVCTSHR